MQHTVQDRFANRHNSRTVTNKHSNSALLPIHKSLLTQKANRRRTRRSSSLRSRLSSKRIHNIQVIHIHQRLNDIEEPLRSREAILCMVGFPSVYVVHLPVQLVGSPDRPLVFSAWHGMWSQHYVAGIPHYQWKRYGEPYESDIRGRMRPFGACSYSFAPALRGSELLLGEAFGLAARGYHGDYFLVL